MSEIYESSLRNAFTLDQCLRATSVNTNFEERVANYRNRKLLDLAHNMPCMADFPHQCTGYLGCDPAHSDSSIFGRGFSFKSHDFAYAAMCNPSHKMLDTFDNEAKKFEWLRAYVKTQKYLWENKLVRVSRAEDNV